MASHFFHDALSIELFASAGTHSSLPIFYFFNFFIIKTISPFRISHSQSILSPSFSFHCFIILMGITVRNEAKLDDALDTVVISPTVVILHRMSISLTYITLYIAICITIMFIGNLDPYGNVYGNA